MKTSARAFHIAANPPPKKLLTVDYAENRICKHIRYLRKPLVWTVAFILAALLPCAAQPFQIESLQFDAQLRPRLSVPADTNSYYRLLAGQEIGSLEVCWRCPSAILSSHHNQQRIARDIIACSRFRSPPCGFGWRRNRRPLGVSTQSGPAACQRRAQIVPRDTRNWLEDYVAEKAVTFAYQYAPDQATYGGGYGESLAQDPISKAIYASGRTRGDDGISRALILKSTDGGITWSTNAPILDWTCLRPWADAPCCVWILAGMSTQYPTRES
jgi:hypothetical protein